jgi:hypothetical protein
MAQPTASRETERHAFVKAVHGVRYQVKGRRALGGVLHATSRIPPRTSATARVRERLSRRRAAPAQRPGRVGLAPDAQRATSGAWRVEPRRVGGYRSFCRDQALNNAGVHGRTVTFGVQILLAGTD